MDALDRAKKIYAEMDFSKFAVVTKPLTYTMSDGLMEVTQVFNNGTIEILHATCQPGCHVEPHTHEETENILVYEGELTQVVNDIPHHMTPGSTTNIPAHTVHYTKSAIGCKLLIARYPPVTGVY